MIRCLEPVGTVSGSVGPRVFAAHVGGGGAGWTAGAAAVLAKEDFDWANLGDFEFRRAS